jgi:hypothetical protein
MLSVLKEPIKQNRVVYELHKFSHDVKEGDKKYFLIYRQYITGYPPMSASHDLTEDELNQLRIELGKPSVYIDDVDKWKQEQNAIIKQKYETYMEHFNIQHESKLAMIEVMEKELKKLRERLINYSDELHYIDPKLSLSLGCEYRDKTI